jgi:16S rRNA U516 pseudouridylate synthase RsuA-like enzyme
MDGEKMSEEAFNMSLRKFLKQVGVTSQREIEELVRSGNATKSPLKVRMELTAEGTKLKHVVEGSIDLP